MTINLKNKNLIIFGLIIVCFILGGGMIFLSVGQNRMENNIISAEEAAGLALDYINKEILGGYAQANLVGAIEEEGNFYKFQVDIEGNTILSYIKKDGSIFFPQAIDLKEEANGSAEDNNTEENQQEINGNQGESSATLGNFSVSSEEVCKENEKPIVYFFGASWCPHCNWEHPIIEDVASSFEDYIFFHDNIDSEDDIDIFYQYSPEGYIPTLVLGCKYHRTGAGEVLGEEGETEILTALICKLTNNQPIDICNKVEDLVNQIYD